MFINFLYTKLNIAKYITNCSNQSSKNSLNSDHYNHTTQWRSVVLQLLEDKIFGTGGVGLGSYSTYKLRIHVMSHHYHGLRASLKSMFIQSVAKTIDFTT